MKLQKINLNLERPDILRAKRNYGFQFGAVIGLGFSVFTWGTDAYTLSMYHGLYPWAKLVAGIILCTGIGGVTGWLTARVNKSLPGLVLWLITASVYAWLTINLPLKFVPRFLSVIEPATRALLHYTYYQEFNTRVVVAYTWIAIFIAIAGLLQIPLSDSAVFSTSLTGKLGPLTLAVILMGICGVIVDNSMINEPLRSAVTVTDNTVQFVVDNQGRDVDPAESRAMHVGAFRTTKDLVTQHRRLIVSGYDKYLSNIRVLIQFDASWVECQILYNQPLSCEAVKGIP